MTLSLVEARVARLVRSAAVVVARHAMALAVLLCRRTALADALEMGAVPYKLPDVVTCDLRYYLWEVAKKVLMFAHVLSAIVLLFQSLQSWMNITV